MDLAPGALVAGKYELERRIGAGGMGEVWAAVQQPTRKRVALKFLRADKASDDPSEGEATRKRFLREARAACAVRHPNVVEVHDVLSLDDGSPVMVMEYLKGETLEARLAREGRLPLGEVAAIAARVVSAVGAAHALGIVHRDLKPDNVFLAETSDGVEVKVLDFGIAKLTALDGDAAQTGGLTNTGAMLGTPYYMSPEQAFGEKNIDHRADVWSLGIILYRAATGVLPTRADNIGQILKIIMMGNITPIESLAPTLPADFASLVSRMLQARREDRPESLHEVRATLERYAGIETGTFGRPLEEPRPAEAAPAADGITTAGLAGDERAAPPKRAGPRVLLSAMAAVALGGGGLWMALRDRGAPASLAIDPATSAVAAARVEASAAPVTAALEATPAAMPAPAPPSASAAPLASTIAPPAPPGPPSLAAGPRPTGRAPQAPPPAATATPASSPPRGDAPSMGGVVATPPTF